MSYRLKNLVSIRYGESLPEAQRLPGEELVYGSNGPVGTHESKNTHTPAIILGRKGSHGKVTWAARGGFCIDTAFWVDQRFCNGNLRYVYYLLQTLGLDKYSKDSAVPGLDRFETLNRPIRQLDLTGQDSIASFLDLETSRIDELIEKKQTLVELLEEKLAIGARTILSGVHINSESHHKTTTPWLSQIPISWQIVPLRHLVCISTGARGTQDRTDDGWYPFFVRSPIVERINTYSFDEEAVLTSGDGVGVGKVFHHVNCKFDLHQRMYAFTQFRRVSGRYFFHFIRAFFHFQMTQWSAKSTVDSVRLPFLKNMLFAVPPKREQEVMLELLDLSEVRATTLIEKTEKSISSLRALRTSLITAAVTGQIDVNTWRERGETDRRLDNLEESSET